MHAVAQPRYNDILQLDFEHGEDQALFKSKIDPEDDEMIMKSKKFRRKKLPPMEGKASVNEILKYIFPPRKVRMGDQVTVANVSSK